MQFNFASVSEALFCFCKGFVFFGSNVPLEHEKDQEIHVHCTRDIPRTWFSSKYVSYVSEIHCTRDIENVLIEHKSIKTFEPFDF